MEKQGDNWKLKRNHVYFYQVQMQMAICKVSYCDFVVWSESGCIVERTKADYEFYKSKLEILHDFFVHGMLPEIIGKWYTQRPVSDAENMVPIPKIDDKSSDCEDEDMTRLWCYCQEPSFGDMILCDNENCSIKWFHFDCLWIRCPPKNHWYCPSCQKLPNFCRAKGANKRNTKMGKSNAEV